MNQPERAVRQDYQAAVRALRANTSRSWPRLAGEKELVCQKCASRTTFNGTLTSTRCPYCVSPIRREDVHEAPGRLPVDGVVPFEVDPMVAKEAIEAWIGGRRFVPSRFKRYKQTGSFARIYASCFTYDGEARTVYEGRRRDEGAPTTGGSPQETSTRWREVSGTVHTAFSDLCVLANDGFEEDKVRALEPWPTHKAKPISAEYVAGHLCRTYDSDVEEGFAEAKRQLDGRIATLVRRDIGGEDQRIDALATTFEALTFKHVLVPIWLLTVIFERKPFQVFIDGVTGEVHGVRPLSKVKVALATLGALAAVLATVAGARQIVGGS